MKNYRIATRWKWFLLVASPLLTALMIWGAWEITRKVLEGKSTSPLWLGVLLAALLATLGVFFLGALVWAFRSSLSIEGEEMVVQGLIFTRRITPDRMAGFRYIQGKMHLYLKDREWPVQLAYYDSQGEIDRWVRQRTTDLRHKDRLEENEKISRDLTLGLTEEDRTARLIRLRRMIARFNWAAYVAATLAFLNALFLKREALSDVVAGVLIFIPLILDWIALHHRGHVHVDAVEGSRFPEIFSGSLACGLGLTVMSVLDKDILLIRPFLYWFAPVLLLKAMIWLAIDRDRIRTLDRQGRIACAITVAAFLLLPSFWVGGGIYQFNKRLDQSPAIWHATTVLEKRVSRGKSVRYTVKLAPWAKDLKGPMQVDVSVEEYHRLAEGKPARIGLRRGALSIPWVIGVMAN